MSSQKTKLLRLLIRFVLPIVIIALGLVLLPLIVCVAIFLLARYRGAFLIRVRMYALFLEILLRLPAVWITQHELHTHISEKHIDVLAAIARSSYIRTYLKVSSTLSDSAVCKVIVDAFVATLFAKKVRSKVSAEYLDAWYYPSNDRTLLYPVGDDRTGRILSLPTHAIDVAACTAAQNGEQIYISFIRRKTGGKPTPPKPKETLVPIRIRT